MIAVWKQFRIFHERNAYLKAAVLRGRRARYEAFWALKDVNLTVHKGEIVSIVYSASGSGVPATAATKGGAGWETLA